MNQSQVILDDSHFCEPELEWIAFEISQWLGVPLVLDEMSSYIS